MNEAPLPDKLEAFLQQPPSVAANAETRAEIFERTRALLPTARAWRRWPIGLAAAASLVVAFLGGYLMGQVHPLVSAPPKHARENGPLDVKRPEPQGPDQALPPPAPPPVVAPPIDPLALENAAFDAATDGERIRLYFRAGDLYFGKHNDVDSALRCYRQALAYCEPRELEFNPDDNWLVMALKRDQRKEN